MMWVWKIDIKESISNLAGKLYSNALRTQPLPSAFALGLFADWLIAKQYYLQISY